MAWHSQTDRFVHGLSPPVRRTFAALDSEAKRRRPWLAGATGSSERLRLEDLGIWLRRVPDTGHVAGCWTRDETRVTRRVFERFETTDGKLDSTQRQEALALLAKVNIAHSHRSVPEVKKMLREIEMRATDSTTDLEGFRKIYASLRDFHRNFPAGESPAPPSRPQLTPRAKGEDEEGAAPPAAVTTPTTEERSTRRRAQPQLDDSPSLAPTALSTDDGGAAGHSREELSPAIAADAEEGRIAGTRPGSAPPKRAAPTDPELEHVQRVLVARADRNDTCTEHVLREHQVYNEGFARAVDASRTEWQLDLLKARDLVKAKRVQASSTRKRTLIVGLPPSKDAPEVRREAGL